MAKRWTMKELKAVTNKRLLLSLIQDRQDNLHPYAPLNERLDKLAKFVRAKIRD